MDPYKILGVASTAKQDEIKSAYRKLAKKLHPDLNPGNKNVENKFKEVNNAYELVGTPEARTKFDRGETEDQQRAARRSDGRSRTGGAGAQSGESPFYYYETQTPGSRYSSNFEGINPDIFADLFGGASRSRSRGGFTPPPEHSQYAMEVDFQTSILGGEREITLPSGKKLRVKIPAGIKSGTKLRLAGQGENGDALIEITVQPSDQFTRLGNDIEVELPLSLNEVILGGEVRVPTVDGAVMLKVPKGLSSGARIRVKGKGVPSPVGNGDQFAVVKIVMPSTIDSDLEKFMTDWSKEHSYDPRKGKEAAK